MKLTAAQVWALRAVAEHPGIWPSYLGQQMMNRPGVADRRRGGNQNSPQGLGRIGGTMMKRLEAKGLVKLRYSTNGRRHATRAFLTENGRSELEQNA